MHTNPSILTIAGSDSGGGAGIQADLKTFIMLGGFGASVITALTAQNTKTVAGIHPVPAPFVAQQLSTVLSDLTIRAAKTGMLFSEAIIKAVSSGLLKRSFPLVVDPVCVSQSGAPLLEDSAVTAMQRDLFPMADLVTPNIPEAELFTGMKISSVEDICTAADRMLSFGSRAVLIKGGHMDSPACTDWFVAIGQKPIPLMQPRVETKNLHGTGCALSAAITAYLGLGHDMLSAVRRGQLFMQAALRSSFSVGAGGGSPNHAVPLLKEQGRVALLAELSETGRALAGLPGFARLIPEVRSNLALALPFASVPSDVAAFSGRITCTHRGEVIVAGGPEFGASSHMSRVVLAAMKSAPNVRCGLNIRHNEGTLLALRRSAMVTASFERSDEPSETRLRDGGTMDWGTMTALERHKEPTTVDAVVDAGGPGKEPMIRILAGSSTEMLDKVRRILEFS
jgi:hydroxymethylpyrimidine/phosphomethylpyrimidine kinase